MVIERVRHWFKPSIEKKQQPLLSEYCVISFNMNAIKLVHFDRDQNALLIKQVKTYPFTNQTQLASQLAGLMRQFDEQKIPFFWVLPPEEYQLFLIESLPVDESELQDALKWRIRSLINYPVEEAAIDYFPLPNKSSNKEGPIIAVIVTKKSSLEPTLKLLEKVDVTPAVIDIPELAIRNLTALYEEDEKSSAFLYFYGNIAILCITRKKTLYFTRHLNLLKENQIDQETCEQLTLDIIRYFDYFQSQWRFPSPNRIFVGGQTDNLQAVVEGLSKGLSLAVEPYKLDTSHIQVLTKENIQPYLLEIGCGLREET